MNEQLRLIMNSNIDFQSTNRFLMSLGFAFCITAIILTYLLLTFPPTNLVLILWIFAFSLLVMGFFLLYKGFTGLKATEDQDERLKFELMVNHILNQDLQFINLKIRSLEYNEKVRDLKKNNVAPPLGLKELNEIYPREFPAIAKQALDPDFYDKIYPNLIINKRKNKNDNNFWRKLKNRIKRK